MRTRSNAAGQRQEFFCAACVLATKLNGDAPCLSAHVYMNDALAQHRRRSRVCRLRSLRGDASGSRKPTYRAADLDPRFPGASLCQYASCPSVLASTTAPACVDPDASVGVLCRAPELAARRFDAAAARWRLQSSTSTSTSTCSLIVLLECGVHVGMCGLRAGDRGDAPSNEGAVPCRGVARPRARGSFPV